MTQMRFIDRWSLEAALILDVIDGALDRLSPGRRVRPEGGIRAFITAQQTPVGMRPLRVPLELVLKTNGEGFHLFFGEVRSIQRNSQPTRLFPGTYDIALRNPLYQEERLTLALPDSKQAHSVMLLPGFSYAFPSGVTVLYGTLPKFNRFQRPVNVTGAVVGFQDGSGSITTDASGDWFLWERQTSLTTARDLTFTLPGRRTFVRTIKDIKRGSRTKVTLSSRDLL